MVLSASVRAPWSRGAAHFNVVSLAPASGIHSGVAGGSVLLRASDRRGGGRASFFQRISQGNYGDSSLPARQFSPAPQNVTHRRACGIRKHVPPVRRATVREPRPRALRDESPHREVQKNLAGTRHVIMSAQAEAPLEPQHERQRGGDEQAVRKMPAHERPHRKVRLQHPAVHRVGRTREDTQRVAPVAERRSFQSSAKITAPDPIARRSFRKMITQARYAARPCGQANTAATPQPQFVPLPARARLASARAER